MSTFSGLFCRSTSLHLGIMVVHFLPLSLIGCTTHGSTYYSTTHHSDHGTKV